jgi:hypothetical protein
LEFNDDVKRRTPQRSCSSKGKNIQERLAQK